MTPISPVNVSTLSAFELLYTIRDGLRFLRVVYLNNCHFLSDTKDDLGLITLSLATSLMRDMEMWHSVTPGVTLAQSRVTQIWATTKIIGLLPSRNKEQRPATSRHKAYWKIKVCEWLRDRWIFNNISASEWWSAIKTLTRVIFSHPRSLSPLFSSEHSLTWPGHWHATTRNTRNPGMDWLD